LFLSDMQVKQEISYLTHWQNKKNGFFAPA